MKSHNIEQPRLARMTPTVKPGDEYAMVLPPKNLLPLIKHIPPYKNIHIIDS